MAESAGHPTTKSNLVTRFAPTPSGFLHMGNAVSFIMTWLIARKAGGQIHLRIDDLDTQHMKSEFLEDIFRELDWLGLDYDTGPQGPDEHARKFSHSLRIDRYHHVLQMLQAQENSPLYACDCSRTKVKSNSGGDCLVYPGTCQRRGLPFDKDNAWRLRLPDGGAVVFEELFAGPCAVDLMQETGDFVVRRKDGMPGFHVVSLLDDIDAQVNFVVRGEDLLSSSAAQVHLSRYIVGSCFHEAQFYHHPLLFEGDKQKYSKSRDSSPLFALHKKWGGPEPIYRALSVALGLGAHNVDGPDELLEVFPSQVRPQLVLSSFSPEDYADT